MMRDVEHVSFDLDGTLIDSFPVMKQAWDASTRELGVTCGFEEYRKFVGLPFPRILQHLGLENLTKELSDLYFSKTRDKYGDVDEIDGASEVLSWCRDAGLGVSINTSKPRMNAEIVIELLGFDVDMLICGDDLAPGKPDPKGARLLSEAMGVPTERMLYVGDMIFDFQFALNSGMRFLLLNPGGQAPLPRNLLNPVTEISCLMDLKSHLARD